MRSWTAQEAEREARRALRRLAAEGAGEAGASDDAFFGALRALGLHPMHAEYVVARLAARGEIARDEDGTWRLHAAPPVAR